MKVLHINYNYREDNLHKVMLEHLEKKEVTNRVFVPLWNKCTIDNFKDGNIVMEKCFSRLDCHILSAKSRKIVNRIEAAYNVEDFDVLHAYTLFSDGYVAYKLKKKYGKNYVVAVRDTDVNIFFKKRPDLRKRGVEILRNASNVFFLSKVYKDYVMNNYVPDKYKADIEKKTYIIPNGIDDFWLNNINSKRCVPDFSKEVKIVYAGRINKNKNPITTQKALQILREEGYNTTFCVIGKVQEQETYEEMLKDQFTHYVKAQPKESLIEYYREGDIFIMPSHHETFGLVYAEAMSQGLPVIYTKGQGFDGQYDEGEVGYSVAPSDERQIAEAVKKIIANYEKISSNCINKVGKFTWDAICQRYKDIYTDIVLNEK